MPLQVTYENKPEDIRVIFRCMTWLDWLKEYAQALSLLLIVLPMGVMFLVLQEWEFLTYLAIFSGLCSIFLVAYLTRQFYRFQNKTKVPPGSQTLRLWDDYLELEGERGIYRRPWTKIRRVVNLPDYLALYIQSRRAFLVSKTYFESPEQAEQFAEQAEALRKRALEHPSSPPDWPALERQFGFDKFQLIDHFHLEDNRLLMARLYTSGIDPEGNRKVPTTFGLVKQLIVPTLLMAALIWARFQEDPSGLGGVTTFYYLLLIIATLSLLVFGMQFFTWFRFRQLIPLVLEIPDEEEIWLFEEGIGTLSEDGVGLDRWVLFDDVAEDHEALVFFDVNRTIQGGIPKSLIPDPERQQALLERLKDCIDIAHDRKEEIVLAEVSDNPFQSPGTN